ncbi:MAG: alanine racemase [Candidatus Methylomirabilota bacterium]
MLSYRDGRLALDELPLAQAAERFGTPLFLFSAATLRENFAALSSGLDADGGPAAIRYCVKTNHEAAILSLLAACGSHAMVSHPAEAALALASGFPPDRLAYQRPVLLVEDLRALLGMGVTRLHASHLSDLELIERVADELDRPVRVSLRVGTPGGAGLSPFGYLARRLGLTDRSLFQAAARLRRSRRLELAGINAYLGTQQESVGRYRHLVRGLVRTAERLQDALGTRLEEIDIGGGFPSPHLGRLGLGRFRRHLPADLEGSGRSAALETFARRVGASYAEAAAGRLGPRPRLVAELGRAVVGSAGILLTRVRTFRGRWAFLDASRHALPESPLLFWRQVLLVAEPARRVPRRAYHLSGATLDTLDVLGMWRRLPPLEAGALLALCDAGAYSLSRATRYAGLLPAACLVESDGSCRQIRRAETLADLAGPMGVCGGPGSGA